MSTFKQQLFLQFANQGLHASSAAFMNEYQPKKDNRFNYEGITYEIAPPRLHENSIEFEISSKIPQDELTGRDDFTTYFAAIKEFLIHDPKQPEDIDLENIIHQDMEGEETKERDYVRLIYRYRFADMYDDATVAAEIARARQDPDGSGLPAIPNVNTLAGRVVLHCIQRFMREESTIRMRRLIEANQEVRQGFSKPAAR